MKYDLLDNLQLDNEGMAKAIAREIDSIIAQGGTDSSRLAQEAAQNPTDASTWFDLGVALIADADMLDYLMAQKYLMENPGTEIDENTVYLMPRSKSRFMRNPSSALPRCWSWSQTTTVSTTSGEPSLPICATMPKPRRVFCWPWRMILRTSPQPTTWPWSIRTWETRNAATNIWTWPSALQPKNRVTIKDN